MNRFNFVIVGAGIVGLSVAYELVKRFPSARILILEKESTIGKHASGRNSGVVHCGIYYPPGSLKVKVCANGAKRLIEFAEEHSIGYKKSGKVIIATSQAQLKTIDLLINNAHINGINARIIDQYELNQLEPNAAPSQTAIFCPDTAVIDSLGVINKLHQLLQKYKVEFFFNSQIHEEKNDNQFKTNHGMIAYDFLFNCAGAYADKVANLFGLQHNYSLIPFKGIYWKLKKEANNLVQSNIYPVPDINLPFLGVHFTKVVSGDIYVGPTAIPTFGRENYSRLKGINIREAWDISFQIISMFIKNSNNFRYLAYSEILKYRKQTFLGLAKKLVPKLKVEDLVPTSKAGIRPQLINKKTKKLEMDYIIVRKGSGVHVLNAISPAFTSSFAFAELIVAQVGKEHK